MVVAPVIYIYISANSGSTWTRQTSAGSAYWSSVASSADGNKLSAAIGVYSWPSYAIYTYSVPNPQLSVDILSPLASSTLSIWSPYVSWGTATECYYSYDNFVSTSTSNCSLIGNDIQKPVSFGTSTLYIKGINAQGTVAIKQSTFKYNLGVIITSPTGNVGSWSPSVNWNVNNVATDTLSCYYSYDNFISTSTAVCDLGGNDIVAPSDGTSTLYAKVIDQGNNIGTTNTTFDLSTWTQKTSDVARTWQSVASSADGNKLVAVVRGGYIYISTDSGNTWVQKTSDALRDWRSVASSADGTKLAAVSYGDYMYISTDSGETWSTSTSAGLRTWYSVASSADGVKLVASASGYIYTSIDSGNTWIERSSAGSRNWYSVSSSADGVKLVAVAASGYIYTSIDSGLTWVQKIYDATRTWQAAVSSTDGTKLAAVVNGGYIYISTDSGNTWATSTSSGSRNWRSITSSADGTKLAAVVGGTAPGYIYTSIDSGNTWTSRMSAVAYDWTSISSDASGDKLAAVSNYGYIYTSTSANPQFDIDLLTPVESSSIYIWSPYVSWGTATECYYSYDNFVSTSTANCSLIGNDIQKPSPLFGTSTLYVRGIDAYGNVITKESTFRYDLGITIISPVGTIYSWSPDINWNVNNVATSTLACYYSYDNFQSTSTADCNLGGSDMPIPVDGPGTLYLKVVDQGGNVSMLNTSFTLMGTWIRHISSGSFMWSSIDSSADGVRLVATVGGSAFNAGYIYTSTDFGDTWATSTSSGSRNWRSITSSADGTRLAAVASGGYIYTSTDSGNTWVQKTFDATRNWRSITSSADGTKLAAVAVGGYIYTSTNSGNTWVQKTSDAARDWRSITSSADGTKLAAVDYSGPSYTGGYIHTSVDGGNTWTTKGGSSGLRYWYSITSDASGTKLAAIVANGYIYTSIDGGQNWIENTSAGSRQWRSITSSADGTILDAVAGVNNYVYRSINSGNTWEQNTSAGTRYWQSITSSADGSRLAATVSSLSSPTIRDYIYTSSPSSSLQLSVDILTPTASTTVNSFRPFVSFGTAVSCSYSWNGIDWNTLNCANNGTDISRPASLGTSTLYVKGTDINNVTVSKQSTFSYSYYIWCGTMDSDWSTVGNWYTDDACSAPTGAVPTGTIDAYVVGSSSPIINTNTWIMPAIIDTTGLIGSALDSGVIFTGTSSNSAYVTGNATFAGSTTNNAIINGNANFIGASRNTGTITGSATFNTSYFTSAVGGTLTIPTGSSWTGTVGGTVYGSDNAPITNYVFNGDASNLSTINGNATFNNTSPFTIGTVNGTVTLNGFSQILSGVNNVTNFFKQLISGVRDTLYFTSGSTLNISGLTTILGSDASNLLTIRTTSPNAPANIGINGTSDLNYLRIKDIYNTGSSLDLSSRTVYDDGGNSGFTFKPNSTPSQRSGGIALTYTPPVYVPPVTPPTGGDDTTDGGKTTKDKSKSEGSSGGSFFKKLGKVDLDKLSLANLPSVTFSGLSSGSSLGTSKFVNPLADLLKLQPVTGFNPLPKVSWLEGISKFLNSSLPQSLVTLGNSVPSIKKELTIAGIKNGYDLYTMKESPINTPTLSQLSKDKTKQPTNLIFVSVDNKETPTKLSIDKKGRAYQILTVAPNSTIDINVKSTDKTLPEIVFDNNEVQSKKDKNGNVKVSLNAPVDQGTRALTVGNLKLEIRVVKSEAPAQPKVEKKLSPIVKMWSWFGK